MAIDTRILGMTAFGTYFGLDMLTTFVAIRSYGVYAESNPAMLVAFGTFGLAGFIAVKLALSLLITVPAYALSVLPGTRHLGISALTSIIAGGMLVSLNNVSALATGASLFHGLYGDGSFAGPGLIVGFTMLFIGALTYGILSQRARRTVSRAFH